MVIIIIKIFAVCLIVGVQILCLTMVKQMLNTFLKEAELINKGFINLSEYIHNFDIEHSRKISYINFALQTMVHRTETNELLSKWKQESDNGLCNCGSDYDIDKSITLTCPVCNKQELFHY